jgi:curved DNA-binding protein CbpA
MDMSCMPNLYEVLGLAVGAKREVIKAAFHKLAKSSHPDINADDSTAEERFKEINQAYEILSDSQKRTAYDLGLKHKLTASHRSWQIAMAVACLVVTLACGLSVFMVSQYFASQESTGKDSALRRLTQQVAELTDLLSLEKDKDKSLEDKLASLQASLSLLRADNERLSGVAGLSGEKDARIAGLTKELDEQKGLSNDALARIDLLNQQLLALQRQTAVLNEALVAAQSKDKESRARISYLGARLNVVLARQVHDLHRYLAGAASDRFSSAQNSPPQRNRQSESPAQRYHSIGMEQLQRGDVAGARSLFELAAKIGLKQSMDALAGTYDPAELAKLNVLGIEPNVREARNWYEAAGNFRAIAAMEKYLSASVEREKIAADLARFRAAYTSGEGLAYVILNEETAEEVYRYGNVSRSKNKEDPQTFTLFTCDTPHVFTTQKAEDISRLLKATVVNPGDRRFAELKARYLAACTDSPSKSPRQMDPFDASGRASYAHIAEALVHAENKIWDGDLKGARAVLEEHLRYDNDGGVTFALAETYDPNILASRGSHEDANTKIAKVLYRRALELGTMRAKMRLDALE